MIHNTTRQSGGGGWEGGSAWESLLRDAIKRVSECLRGRLDRQVRKHRELYQQDGTIVIIVIVVAVFRAIGYVKRTLLYRRERLENVFIFFYFIFNRLRSGKAKYRKVRKIIIIAVRKKK